MTDPDDLVDAMVFLDLTARLGAPAVDAARGLVALAVELRDHDRAVASA